MSCRKTWASLAWVLLLVPELVVDAVDEVSAVVLAEELVAWS